MMRLFFFFWIILIFLPADSIAQLRKKPVAPEKEAKKTTQEGVTVTRIFPYTPGKGQITINRPKPQCPCTIFQLGEGTKVLQLNKELHHSDRIDNPNNIRFETINGFFRLKDKYGHKYTIANKISTMPNAPTIHNQNQDSDDGVEINPYFGLDLSTPPEALQETERVAKGEKPPMALNPDNSDWAYQDYQNATQPTVYSTTSETLKNTSTQSARTLALAEYSEPAVEVFNGYTIQVAATKDELTESNIKQYEPLTQYGNLYTKSEGDFKKIRVGIFPTKEEAMKNLNELNKDSRFKDAFILEERGADQSLVFEQSPDSSPAQYSATIAAKSTTSANSDILYAVQLGSFASNAPVSANDYTKLSDIGNVYSKTENNSIKVRLGVWRSYVYAEKALTEIINRGGKDAIIVTEKADDQSLKSFTLTEDRIISISDIHYFIRLCALINPENFDPGQIEKIGVEGTLEKWPIGNTDLTAIMLAGYSSLKTANSDLEKLRSHGFPDAYVIKEKNGQVSREKSN